MKRFGIILNKKGYVKKTQSMRSRNKVVDGEPVAEQKKKSNFLNLSLNFSF